MLTADLFPQSLIRQGLSIVPTHAQAATKRDTGIARAAAHTDHVYPEWKAKALGYVKLHALCARTMLAEDIRNMATLDGLEAPPDARAWGQVMRAAAKAGVVRAYGYAPARSSNLSPKVLWESLIFEGR